MTGAAIEHLAATCSEPLRRATLGNMNWSDARFTMDDVRTRPDFAHYTALLSSRGDVGVVASTGRKELGVCWALFLPIDEPGHGFVDGHTPEVSLWVADGVMVLGVEPHVAPSSPTAP